jgi:hypothetical protein
VRVTNALRSTPAAANLDRQSLEDRDTAQLLAAVPADGRLATAALCIRPPIAAEAGFTRCSRRREFTLDVILGNVLKSKENKWVRADRSAGQCRVWERCGGQVADV